LFSLKKHYYRACIHLSSASFLSLLNIQPDKSNEQPRGDEIWRQCWCCNWSNQFSLWGWRSTRLFYRLLNLSLCVLDSLSSGICHSYHILGKLVREQITEPGGACKKIGWNTNSDLRVTSHKANKGYSSITVVPRFILFID